MGPSTERINITLPRSTLAALDKRLEAYKRSQFLSYAARALLERLEGRVVDAVGYEQAARALLRGTHAAGSTPPGKKSPGNTGPGNTGENY